MSKLEFGPGWATRVCRALAPLLLLAGGLVSDNSLAFDPLQDARTIVNLTANFAGSPTNFAVATDDAKTNFDHTLTSTRPDGTDLTTLGWAQGIGVADFGKLKLKLRNNIGSTFSASVGASFHDVFTVSSSGNLAPGTPGVLTFVYGVGGTTIIDYDPIKLNELRDNGQTLSEPILALMGFGVTKIVSNGAGGVIRETFDEYPQKIIVAREDLPAFGPGSVGNGGFYNVFIKNQRYEFDIPFNYDEPFGLQTSFSIATTTATSFFGQTSNPFFLHYGSTVLNEMTVDFLNTADLLAIVNPLDPGASVTGVNLNYSGLVTATVPAVVPLPGALWLMSSPLTLMLFRAASAKRKNRANRKK